jgi:hypothetical protein
MELNFLGLVAGIVTFVIIGAFHPLVVKTEYHVGKKIWPLFLALGLLFTAASLCIKNAYISVILAIIAFTCFWTIVELYEQEKRVARGWHPKKPKPPKPADKVEPAGKPQDKIAEETAEESPS